MKGLSLKSLANSIGRFFGRFHLTLFIIIIVAGLGSAVILLNELVTDTSVAGDYISPIDAGSIDQDALEQIRALHTSNETVPGLSLPSGRTNPFGE